jgi:hypothetical protein
MTAAEIIALTLTRNVSEEHILPSDITIATKRYVDAYITGYSTESAYFTAYCEPVIAHGVIVDIWERLSAEITDRGMVKMLSQGAANTSIEEKQHLRNEMQSKLNDLIELMCDNVPTGVTLTDEADELSNFGSIQFAGNKLQSRL